VLRFTVECGAPGEELKLGIVMTGESGLAAEPLLEPGRLVKVIGRMRILKGSLKIVGALEVVAESIEQVK